MAKNKKNGAAVKAGAKDNCHSSEILNSPETVKTNPLSEGVMNDANVAPEGHCVFTAHAEDARPDTGAPCMDGRDGM